MWLILCNRGPTKKWVAFVMDVNQLIDWCIDKTKRNGNRRSDRDRESKEERLKHAGNALTFLLSLSLCGSPSMREKTFHTTLRFNCVSVSVLTTFAFSRFSTVIKTKSYVITTQRPHTRTRMYSPVLHKHTHTRVTRTHTFTVGANTQWSLRSRSSWKKYKKKYNFLSFLLHSTFSFCCCLFGFVLSSALNVAIDTFLLLLLLGRQTHTHTAVLHFG